MTTITNRIFKFEPMIKKPIVTNHAFFTVIGNGTCQKIRKMDRTNFY